MPISRSQRLAELQEYRPDWGAAEFNEIEAIWANKSDDIERSIDDLLLHRIEPAHDSDLLQLYVNCVQKLEAISTELTRRGY